MSRRSLLGSLVLAAGIAVATVTPAAAQDCGRAVIFTLPGVTWADVDSFEPPNLARAVAGGAAGSVSVRTISSRTSYASGFATIGAGARVEAGRTSRGQTRPGVGDLSTGLRAAGVREMADLADEAGYGAVPGALGSTLPHPTIAIGNADLGLDPAAPVGYGRWALLAAMDATGVVDLGAVDDGLLHPAADAPFGAVTDPVAIDNATAEALGVECALTVIDHGDLIRVDAAAGLVDAELPARRESAVMAADRLLGSVLDRLDPERDLLLVVSPTSPAWADEAHLGVAVAWGRSFAAGTTLTSASTRRAGIVTLPDVAPTILAHYGIRVPASMNGRPWTDVSGPRDPATAAAALDFESTLVDAMRPGVTTAYVVSHVLIYAVALIVLRGPASPARHLEPAGLALMSFPAATFLAGLVPMAGMVPVVYIGWLAALTAGLVLLVMYLFSTTMWRVAAVCALTFMVIAVDLLLGGELQMNTVFGYSPIVAGRFAGLGNIAYAILGIAALLVAVVALELHPRPRAGLGAVAALFVITVVLDGWPSLGSDVGGVLSLVPAFGLTLLMLVGRRIRTAHVLVAGLVAAVSVGLFLVVDVNRPSEEQTHLARTFSDVVERGPSALWDVVERKGRANLRVFRSTIWTYFVPIALATIGILLRRPAGRWRQLAEEHPHLRAGFVGGLLLAVFGFLVNDSGIVVPAVVLSLLAPATLLMHVSLQEA